MCARALLFFLLCTSCKAPDKATATSAPPDRPSPQAQVVPTPLGLSVKLEDAGSDRVWAVADRELQPDDTVAVAQKAFSLLISFRTESQLARLSGQLGPSRLWLKNGNDEGFAVSYPFELRARADRRGHLLLWGGGTRMRGLPPGSLRPFFTDGAFDVVPLSPASGPELSRTTSAARVLIQKGTRVGLGDAGNFLMRTLAEFAQAMPALFVCAPDE